jgi:hypothetical protein
VAWMLPFTLHNANSDSPTFAGRIAPTGSAAKDPTLTNAIQIL